MVITTESVGEYTLQINCNKDRNYTFAIIKHFYGIFTIASTAYATFAVVSL